MKIQGLNSFRGWFKFLINEFLLAGHIMSIGGAMIAFSLSYFLSGEFSVLGALSLYFIIQSIYWFDRFYGFQIDKYSKHNKQRNSHIKTYMKFIPFIITIYLFLSVFINTFGQKINNFYMSIIMILLGLLYPIIFKKITRYIPGFKNFFVAFFYVSFIFYALFYQQVQSNFVFIILFTIFVFTRSLIIQIFLDTKDIKEDRGIGLKTFPVILGLSRSIKLMTLLNIFSLFNSLLFLFLQPPLNLISLIFLLIIYSLVIISNFKKKATINHYIAIGLEYFVFSIILILLKSFI